MGGSLGFKKPPTVYEFLALRHVPYSFEKKRKMLSAQSFHLTVCLSTCDLRHVSLLIRKMIIMLVTPWGCGAH